MQPILRQLDQYGYSQVDGFLGDANGYPEQIRAEMKSLFDKGFFEEEPESDAQFKVGPYRITNQDREHRFRYRIKGRSGEERMEQLIQNQYEIAPTVVNFARSLLVSFARPLGELTESGLSNTKGISELFVLCGQGARYDRRVSNVYGWQTEQGFVRDPRKLVAIYFSNPNYREELGGVLQLEGVITPTGAVRISPVADRLVLFWADKTVP
ncbi:Hypoxia-inducible factor prolyl hydroxylase (HIF-PH) (Egg-laying defective protein 9) (Hypoxia-inducible factor-proline dioxygenase) [Durusdinium trenchii]|uniref:Hypoxia-inducible factor prolyl hydroxylase (HIF-PH) (Egg-laying defective protein 9) (Hypoxia-inducible factor-proline dioxygenase) n=1 Tax=Durusdinium trenchii TaxID=1381693 RepID=A0ABP0KWZ3_9DINO